MKIRTKTKYLAKVAAFSAGVLGIRNISLTIRWSDKDECSECLEYDDGSFEVRIQQDLDPDSVVKHVAHEMTHVRQHKHNQLVSNEHGRWWNGEYYPEFESPYCDAYWLSPWEMEARAMEEFVLYKWRDR